MRGRGRRWRAWRMEEAGSRACASRRAVRRDTEAELEEFEEERDTQAKQAMSKAAAAKAKKLEQLQEDANRYLKEERATQDCRDDCLQWFGGEASGYPWYVHVLLMKVAELTKPLETVRDVINTRWLRASVTNRGHSPGEVQQ